MLSANFGVYPNHPCARLYLKDVNASRDMFYDEDEKRRRDRLSQVLNVPVTDFELSVRSRNCLQKMGVMTLGDLAKTTEADLLASKNFGETSLVEIREMMDAKGLSLGMLAKEATAARTGVRTGSHDPRRACAVGPPDCRSESFSACPQVHGAVGHQHHRGIGAPHRRRFAGVQKLRRHQLERSARKVDGEEYKAPRRLSNLSGISAIGHSPMKFSRWVFGLAGIYGLILLPPHYFMESHLAHEDPAGLTHPEFFYGFLGVGIAWQIAFLIIAQIQCASGR